MSTLGKQALVIIDDDAEDCYLLQYLLQREYADLPVLLVIDSQTVIDQLETLAELPMLVLLDMYMPLKSGLEVLQELRAHPRYASVPVAILTGSEDPRQIPELTQLEVVAYFCKATSYEETSQLVQQLMGLLPR